MRLLRTLLALMVGLIAASPTAVYAADGDQTMVRLVGKQRLVQGGLCNLQAEVWLVPAGAAVGIQQPYVYVPGIQHGTPAAVVWNGMPIKWYFCANGVLSPLEPVIPPPPPVPLPPPPPFPLS